MFPACRLQGSEDTTGISEIGDPPPPPLELTGNKSSRQGLEES